MKTPWLNHYQQGVPKTLEPLPYASLVEFFQASCHTYKHQVAFENLGQPMTYQTLQQQSMAFASFLQQSGLKKGDRVAIMLPNLLQYPIAIFGILQAGGIVVNTNPLYTASELVHQLRDADVSFLIVLKHLSHTVQNALPSLTLKKIIVTDVGDCLPILKAWCIRQYLKYIKKQTSPSIPLPNSIAFKQALKQGMQQPLFPATLEPNDIAFLQYTGGTTGISKGAMLTHHNMLSNVFQAFHWIAPLDINKNDIVITALPLYHIFALTANCLTFLRTGAKNILITNPRDINQLIRTIHNKHFTTITGVNTLFNALLHHPKFKNIDFSQLKLTMSGGMSLQKTVSEQWQKLTNCPILEAYGLTETSPAVTINPMSETTYNGSIGLPLPSTLVSIRDEHEKEVPCGEIGELCVQGPQVMLGYWKQPEETKLVFTKDGFLKTGDLAKMDENGFFYLVDRKKDLIIVSGFNVYPNEVEQIISSHPDVLEVGVAGMVDETGNERVKAFVVTSNPDLTEADLIKFCREYLTPYKVPKIIEFKTQLPKTNVGKILRRALSES